MSLLNQPLNRFANLEAAGGLGLGLCQHSCPYMYILRLSCALCFVIFMEMGVRPKSTCFFPKSYVLFFQFLMGFMFSFELVTRPISTPVVPVRFLHFAMELAIRTISTCISSYIFRISWFPMEVVIRSISTCVAYIFRTSFVKTPTGFMFCCMDTRCPSSALLPFFRGRVPLLK